MMPTNLRSQFDYQNAVAELTALQVNAGDTGRAEALVQAIRHYEAVSRAFWDQGNVSPSKSHFANADPEWHWFEGQMD
ncbi:MAG: hypothetical protein KME20_26810 [Kaiparowitsia implicata GSE-PSE-MK54-09C]|jgi:hypothetical protein|nr:hypothetical protein [Kaiparowitsia implicata GSE-PSE-MK54-09C]